MVGGVQRNPDLLNHLSAGLLERALEPAYAFPTEGVILTHCDHFAVAQLLVGVLTKGVVGLAARPDHADDVGAPLALREVVGRHDGEKERHFVLVCVAPDGVALERQQIANHKVHLVVLDNLAHLGDGVLGFRFGVLHEELHLHAAQLSAGLLQIQLEALYHLLGAFRDKACKRYRQTDPKFLRRRGSRHTRLGTQDK